MKLTYDHLIFAAVTCGLFLVTMAHRDAFVELGGIFAG
jgi:hypothetical protein